MNFEEYRQRAKAVESVLPVGTPVPKELLVNVLKIIGTLSDVLDLVKKSTFYGQSLAKSKIDDLMDCVDTDLFNIEYETEKDIREPIKMDLRLLHSLVGFVGEAGEIAKAAVEGLETGEVDKANLLEEFGDSRWYKVIGFDHLGFTEDQESNSNIEKLESRYGKQFSSYKAVNRDLEKERNILEKHLTED
jgi:NTP pyrophosphatase (non-canonical NTP hydrolase)